MNDGRWTVDKGKKRDAPINVMYDREEPKGQAL